MRLIGEDGVAIRQTCPEILKSCPENAETCPEISQSCPGNAETARKPRKPARKFPNQPLPNKNKPQGVAEIQPQYISGESSGPYDGNMKILKDIYKFWFIISGIVSILGCEALDARYKGLNS
ncbi:hypothetical protein QUF79_22830 [Fictibacillus enclensis]|nr:hypothetical protein [Fictibacillus enclensis]